MNLKELVFPIRAYWDLTPCPHGSASGHLNICEEIVKNKILSLHLTDTTVPLNKKVTEILETLVGKNVVVSLTVSGKLSRPDVEHLCRSNVRELLFDVSSSDEVATLADKMRGCGGGFPSGVTPARRGFRWGISLNVSRTNYRDLPEVVSVCAKNGIPCFSIPMQRSIRESECFFIDKKERQELVERVRRVERNDVAITIHDPFLWRVFFPVLQFPEGGCQAANSMVYLSPEGDVYPCPSLPMKLGSLGDSSLEDIMLSSQKRKLRELLLMPPSACSECNEVDSCAGGCRGRAHVLAGSLDVKDPACG